jgi:hypothetical protein
MFTGRWLGSTSSWAGINDSLHSTLQNLPKSLSSLGEAGSEAGGLTKRLAGQDDETVRSSILQLSAPRFLNF